MFIGTVVRLVPLYWLSLLLACLPWLWVWISSADTLRGWYWNFNPRLQGFALDFLMVPHANPDFGGAWWPQNLPGWTLNLQLWLSLMLGLAMLAGRRQWVVFCALIGGTAFAAAYSPTTPALLAFYGQPASLAFVAGAAVFYRYRHRPPSVLSTAPFLLAVVGAVLLFVVAGLSHSSLSLTAVSALGVWLFLRVPSFDLRWARLLGDASYPIYLFHGVLGFPLARWALLASTGLHAADLAAAPGWQRAGAVVWLITVSVASGVAVHYVLERPLLGWIGRHWRGQRGGRSVEMNAPSTTARECSAIRA